MSSTIKQILKPLAFNAIGKGLQNMTGAPLRPWRSLNGLLVILACLAHSLLSGKSMLIFPP